MQNCQRAAEVVASLRPNKNKKKKRKQKRRAYCVSAFANVAARRGSNAHHLLQAQQCVCMRALLFVCVCCMRRYTIQYIYTFEKRRCNIGAALPLVCAQLMQNPRSIKFNRIRSQVKTLLLFVSSIVFGLIFTYIHKPCCPPPLYVHAIHAGMYVRMVLARLDEDRVSPLIFALRAFYLLILIEL